MPTLGAFIVTFHREDHLRRSLEVLMAQTRPPDAVLVVDNGSSAETAALVGELGRTTSRTELLYEDTGANLGSAGGTAYGTRRLGELGFDLIYSGDDDNPPRTPDTLERLLDLLGRSGDEVGGVGTVGARFDWRRGGVERIPDEELEGTLPVDFIGGDHKLILRRAVVEAGGIPDARLFFGYPDLEHCLRLRRDGWALRIEGQLMRQYRELTGKLGLRAVRSPIPRRPRSALWRTYYTTRNYIHMMRSTFQRPDLARRQTGKVLVRSLAAWRKGVGYGADHARFQVRALADGWRGRLGPVVRPQTKVHYR
jgi:GT2 family glycosyltransferase